MHHRISRQNKMRDKSYDKILAKSSLFELGALSILLLAHIPVFFLVPYFYITLIFSIFQYYWIHRKSHINIEWGKKRLPWHYEHHMAKDQHKNWGVRSSMIDKLMRTNT
jgi:sterol desaturase/sphingolipid hydroxylase (fatty acid hydroxylase superfamily)